MAKQQSIIWEMAPHTRAKHAILQRYLQAWVPILSLGGFRKVLYIDGYAGPGIYSGGEPGSPIIALRAARDQVVPISAAVDFLFVEREELRARVLAEQVDAERPSLPENFGVTIENDSFEAAFHKRVNAEGGHLPPTFAFIDPFGWSVPFSVVVEIMCHKSCEVLITFMYEEINRFIGLPDQEANFDKLFGCNDWREGIGLPGVQSRNRFFHDLYLRQLVEVARISYVRSFQMKNDKDVTDYYLFFGTNNLLGLKRMKDAMWRVDTSGEFTFSDATNQDQMVMFGEPNFDNLREQIKKRFAGKEVTRGEVEQFVVCETAFRETHYKKQVLAPMESAGEIAVVNPPEKRRRGSYADANLRLRFQ